MEYDFRAAWLDRERNTREMREYRLQQEEQEAKAIKDEITYYRSIPSTYTTTSSNLNVAGVSGVTDIYMDGPVHDWGIRFVKAPPPKPLQEERCKQLTFGLED